MKRPSLALVDFLPPSHGETAVLKAAEQLASQLTVAILVSEDDPIGFDQRRAWVMAEVPGAHVLAFQRAHLASAQRAEHLKQIMRNADREPAGFLVTLRAGFEDLARELSAYGAVVDADREIFHADPTDIRTDVVAHWGVISDAARNKLRRRIALIGPECAGKSTIGAFITSRYGLTVVPEYGRFHSRVREPGDYLIDELAFINDVSIAVRKAQEPAHGPILIEDTDTLLQIAWAKKLHGRSSAALEDSLELPDHYLLFAPDLAWVDDPVRSMFKHEDRIDLFEIMRATMQQHGATFTVIQGDRVAREAACIEAVEIELERLRTSLL